MLFHPPPFTLELDTFSFTKVAEAGERSYIFKSVAHFHLSVRARQQMKWLGCSLWALVLFVSI